ncbi:Rpn family recombination-promoting nuclease/putative transposase [bacterium]|nr:Rpn family recombination-promoting nuclease/putative transposase [bacterium]
MSNKDAIPQLHDQFFLATMSDVKNATDFLKAKLPTEIASRIDFSHIEVVSSSHHDKKRYRKLYSDLVIKTKLKNSETPAEIYVLFEHKTEQHPRLFHQLLSYMTAMWGEDITLAKTERRKVCFRPIFPLVFYHGPGKWRVPTEFSELFCCGRELKQRLLSFSYTLFDTADWSPTSEERGEMNSELILHLRLFRDAFQRDRESIKQAFNELSELMKSGSDTDYLLLILTYVAQSRKLDFEEIRSLIEESEMDEEVVMSTIGTMNVAEIWKRSGYHEGIEKGIEKGIYAVAEQMLQKGFDVATVADVTKLSEAEIRHIRDSLH